MKLVRLYSAPNLTQHLIGIDERGQNYLVPVNLSAKPKLVSASLIHPGVYRLLPESERVMLNSYNAAIENTTDVEKQ